MSKNFNINYYLLFNSNHIMNCKKYFIIYVNYYRLFHKYTDKIVK